MNTDDKKKGSLNGIFQNIENNPTKPFEPESKPLVNETEQTIVKHKVNNRSFKRAKLIDNVMIPRIKSKSVQLTTSNKYQFYINDDELADWLDGFMRKNHMKPTEALNYIIRDFVNRSR